MRIVLAVAVVIIHSPITSYGPSANIAIFESPLRPFLRLVLPVFFALSGFLVAGSLERSRTLGMFLGLRVIRIYPALACEVVLSALILGPIVTKLGVVAYFHSGVFWSYLLNVMGDIHYSLPGVFSDNPMANTVNGQLWTVPFELYCYLALAAIAVLGATRKPFIAPLASLVVTATYLLVTLVRHHWRIVPVAEAVNGAILIASFLAGVSVYSYRSILPLNNFLGAISAVLSLALLSDLKIGSFFVAFPAAYLTAYLGLMNPTRRYLRCEDYSYGVFLYGYVIQQTWMHMLPGARDWRINILLSVPTALGVAAISWHVVEQPAQRLRHLLKAWETDYLSRRRGHNPPLGR